MLPSRRSWRPGFADPFVPGPCTPSLGVKLCKPSQAVLAQNPRARKAGFRPEIELFDSGDIVLMQGLLKDGALEGPLLVRNGYRSGRQQQRDRTLPTVGANVDDGALAGRHGRQLLHGLTQNACSRGSAFPLAALAQSAEIRSTPCSLPFWHFFGSAAYRGELALSAQKRTS